MMAVACKIYASRWVHACAGNGGVWHAPSHLQLMESEVALEDVRVMLSVKVH